MLVELRKCLTCGKIFKPYKENHLHCNKKCYRKWYWIEIEKKLPSFICPFCNIKIQLTFNIKAKRNRKRWEKFRCPNCGKSNTHGEVEEEL